MSMVNVTTGDEVVQKSEVRRSERAQPFAIDYKPMYSLERTRRRHLCEAVCEGIPTLQLAALAGDMEKLRKCATGLKRQPLSQEARAAIDALMDS